MLAYKIVLFNPKYLSLISGIPPLHPQNCLYPIIHVFDMCVDVLLGNLVPSFASSLLKLCNAGWEMGPASNVVFESFPERFNGAEIE